MKKLKILFIALITLTFNVSAETFVYITDELDIPIRSDKSFGNNIIHLLPSGTELLLIQSTEDGWAQIQFDDTIGWIKSFYLSSNPSARDELKKLKRTHNANVLLINKLQAENVELKNEILAIKYEQYGSEIVEEDQKVAEQEALKAKAQKVFKEVKRKVEEEKLEEEKVREAEILAQEALKQLKKAEENAKEVEILAKEAEEKRKIEEEKAKEAKKKLKQAKEVLANHLKLLKQAYVENIAARIKSNWRYQGAEDDWTAKVYIVQDRDGSVLAVDVRNTNVGDSSRAKVFKDSIRRAVYKSSPLPSAPDDAVFDKELVVTFATN
jgi:SH3 domain protein